MENPDNIVLVCKDCVEKMYPNKGRLDTDVGDFAKVKFTDKNGSEYMWVKVVKADKEKGEYDGMLDNEPAMVTCAGYGDRVSFKKEDIFDIITERN